MIEKVISFVKESKVLLIGSILIGVILAATILPGVVYSKFQSWQKLSSNNKAEEQKQMKIVENINLLNSIDEDKLREYKSLLEDILPAEEDRLRILSIFEIINSAVGLSLDKYEISNANTGSSTQTVIPGKSGASPGTAPATDKVPSGTPATPGQPVATPNGSYNIRATFHGSLTSAINLFEKLKQVKRAVGVESFSINQGDADEKPIITLDFVFPLQTPGAKITAETPLNITAKDSQVLDDLLQSLVIDSSPANAPLGKSNL